VAAAVSSKSHRFGRIGKPNKRRFLPGFEAIHFNIEQFFGSTVRVRSNFAKNFREEFPQ